MQPVQLPCRRHHIAIAPALLLALAGTPAAASPACVAKGGGLPPMLDYVGRDAAGRNLLAAPSVAASLARLPVSVREHFERNLDVSGPVDLIDCHLVLSGNAPHMGGEEDAIIDVDLYSGAVTVAVHGRGRTDVYLGAGVAAHLPGDAYGAVPEAVKQWAVLADMGFPYQKPASVLVHPPPR